VLQRVVLGQVRFNLPGLVPDPRGVVGGKQLAARFAAIDRLVAFLRVLSAEQNLDDFQPGLRIVYARGGAGTREAIVFLPGGAPALGDLVAHAARLSGGQLFTGSGRHFVQYRDARAPLGYDVATAPEGTGDVVLHGLEQSVGYRIESDLPLAKLLLRLSLVRVHGAGQRLPEGPLFVVARRGLGPVVAGYLHRAAASGLRASVAACESGAASAFAAGTAFWLFRVEQIPPRIHGLLSSTPGLELYVPVTEHAAVAAGYRHPLHLASCRASLPTDRLSLFSPRGVTEVAPMPTLAALDDVVRIRAPAVESASPRAVVSARPDLTVPLRLEPSGEPPGHPVAVLVPWTQLRWLQRLCYALPPTALASYRVALLERGVLVHAPEQIEGIPFGTLFALAAPDVLVPIGTAVRPAVSPALLAERLGAAGGAVVLFPAPGQPPVRVPADALAPLEPRVLGSIDPETAALAAIPAPPLPLGDVVEIANDPLGPMPLWGLPPVTREG
jgi:hypothetical protein